MTRLLLALVLVACEPGPRTGESDAGPYDAGIHQPCCIYCGDVEFVPVPCKDECATTQTCKPTDVNQGCACYGKADGGR